MDKIAKEVISAIEGATGEKVDGLSQSLDDIGVSPQDVDYVCEYVEECFGLSRVLKPSVIIIGTVQDVVDAIRSALEDL